MPIARSRKFFGILGISKIEKTEKKFKRPFIFDMKVVRPNIHV
jgi:hypothetical protein